MFFLVRMVHPDGPAWDQHVAAHVAYLEKLVASGSLQASGPVKDSHRREGFLIFDVADRAEALRLVAADPFVTEGVIEELHVHAWDPVFGVFADQSSGKIPGVE